jgi:TRAP transporter TAXI family solute receptor
LAPRPFHLPEPLVKVFCFFFSKKKCFLPPNKTPGWIVGSPISRRSLLAAAALALPARARAATWSDALLMATGRPGGAYDIYGPAWGRLAEETSGIAIAYRASGGAASDILFIEEGAAQLGMTTVTVADQARAGSGGWTAGVRLSRFRALFPMFPSILQMVAPAGAGIANIAGLAGRTVGIGPDGGSAATVVQGIFASVGVLPGRFVTGDFSLQVRDMRAGRLDACAFIAAPPTPAIYQAATATRLRLIGFTQAEADLVAATAPGITPMNIPAGSFPGQSVPLRSVGTPNFAIGSNTLTDPLANALTLAAMRNRASLARIVPAAAMSPQPMLSMPGRMTFHPGAAMALRSLGLDVPERLIEG